VPVSCDIPSESLLQVPVRSALPMPSRSPVAAASEAHAPTIRMPASVSLEASRHLPGACEASQQTAVPCTQQLVRRPRSHALFAGASRGSVVNVPRHSEAQRRTPLQQHCREHHLNPPVLFQGLRRNPSVSSYHPITVPPAAPQGDGDCGWSDVDESSQDSSPRYELRSDAGRNEESDGVAAEEAMQPLAIPRQAAPVSSVAAAAVASAAGTASTANESRPQALTTPDRARSVPPPEREPLRARRFIPTRLRPGPNLGSGSVRTQAPLRPPTGLSGETSEVPGERIRSTPLDSQDVDQDVEQRRLSHHMSAPELPSAWQVAEELGQSGGMAAPRYLLVRLGECIPAETGAAPVHRSRLDSGPQWRDFLNFADGSHPEGVALEEVLTCPCCLSIFRQPIGLPCGHSLCRGCYVRVSSQPNTSRRCPLCRADLPRCDLRVNVALAAVSDALRAFQAVARPRTGPRATHSVIE